MIFVVDGTTDVTRTVHLGTPTDEHKRAYTRVLMSSIQFSTTTFPANIPAATLDAVARSPLWEVGMDYNHPTGHAVGTFLGVHECNHFFFGLVLFLTNDVVIFFSVPMTVSYHSSDFFKPGYFLSSGKWRNTHQLLVDFFSWHHEKTLEFGPKTCVELFFLTAWQ